MAERSVFDQLLDDAKVKGAELERAVQRAVDIRYWRELVPDLHIEATGGDVEYGVADPAAVEAAGHSVASDGYFRLPGAIAAASVRRLNAAIDAVIAAGWPASFVFAYDEAWRAARSPAVGRIVESVLGPGFLQIQHAWAHIVEPVRGASGWSPHLDGDGDARMTVWLALTDATVDNGCMHVIPRSVTAARSDVLDRLGRAESRFSRTELYSLLHAAHALEAAPGDALGWTFDVVHWGGFARRQGRARRSFSFEYVRANEPARASDGPLVAMDRLPTFPERLRSVTSALGNYRPFEPRLIRFADVARQIMARLNA